MAPTGGGAAVWEVVGGADRGGIIVRMGQDLASPQAPERLSTGATVSEQELVGDRLRYQLVAGVGPACGWVSVRLKDKVLLLRRPAPPAPGDQTQDPARAVEALPAASPPAGAGAAGAGVAGARPMGLRAAAPAPVLEQASSSPSPSSPSSSGPASGGRRGKYADLPDMELRKVCKEYGFTPGGLEERHLAPALLERLEQVGRASAAELKNEIRKRGFATPAGMVKEDMLQRLRDILVWEHFRLGELRRVCRELQLPHQEVSQTREAMLQLLCDATWQLRGIPVWRLPSLILAFGVLDQVDALEARSLEDLALMCEKRGLPVEDPPEHEALADRLRTVVVWEHLPLEELRRECEAMGVSTADAQSEAEAAESELPRPRSGFVWTGRVSSERDEQKELVRRLSDLFWQAPPPPSMGELLSEDDPRYPEQVAAYLDIMQLPQTAGSSELRKAYRDLAKKHHPDKNLGAEEQVTAEFQAISEAYAALGEYMRRQGI